MINSEESVARGLNAMLLGSLMEFVYLGPAM